MRQNITSGFAILYLCVLSPWCAPAARASLGGDGASVAADAAALQGVIHSTLLQQYDIREITADNGMRVREFQDRGGLVFAISWSGPALPDLHQLLGTSYGAYAAALPAADHFRPQRSLRVATSFLVVESGGHMRAYAGRAYLPASIPAGTSAAILR
jgi:hypothetical protein